MKTLSRILFVSSAIAAAAVSQAAELAISGTTKAYFGDMGTATSTATYKGLTFTGGTFSTTTVDNEYNIGDVVSGNLGMFALSAAANSYAGEAFTLVVTFTTPTGIKPSQSSNFQAVLRGRVANNSSSGVTVNFDNTEKEFTFSNANGFGKLSLAVNDVSVGKGDKIAISGYGTGQITSAPAPGAMAAFGLGLVGSRRRRNKKA